MSERFLVTGALGCIGAWVVRQLAAEEVRVVAVDWGGSDHRLRFLIGEDAPGNVERLDCDITDLDALEGILRDRAITHLIHLAALQIPFCKADPPLGARVNVVGTVNVFEAVKRVGGIAGPIVFASSVAAYGPPDAGDVSADPEPTGHAATHYGVYKLANEGTAGVYWKDDGIHSVGLRPYVVYGVGRDQGMTSSPTFAMLAAAAGRPYSISYSGTSHLQLAEDVAAAFIGAARSRYRGAGVFNLGGSVVDMTEVVDAIERAAPDAVGRITIDGPPLPLPSEVDHSSFATIVARGTETPLYEGVRSTVQTFRDLIARGALDASALLDL